MEARPPAAERGADEVLPREQDQSGGVVPADRGAVPGLLLALLRPAALREGTLPKYGGSLDWLHLVNITEPSGTAGARLPARHLRDQPADLVLVHVDDDAGRAALDADGAPGGVRALPDQLPVGPDDLLADDQPVDDGTGCDHAQDDPQARARLPSGAREPRRSNPVRAAARLRGTELPRRRAPKPGGTAVKGPPRRVKRKRGGGGRR